MPDHHIKALNEQRLDALKTLEYKAFCSAKYHKSSMLKRSCLRCFEGKIELGQRNLASSRCGVDIRAVSTKKVVFPTSTPDSTPDPGQNTAI